MSIVLLKDNILASDNKSIVHNFSHGISWGYEYPKISLYKNICAIGYVGLRPNMDEVYTVIKKIIKFKKGEVSKLKTYLSSLDFSESNILIVFRNKFISIKNTVSILNTANHVAIGSGAKLADSLFNTNLSAIEIVKELQNYHETIGGDVYYTDITKLKRLDV